MPLPDEGIPLIVRLAPRQIERGRAVPTPEEIETLGRLADDVRDENAIAEPLVAWLVDRALLPAAPAFGRILRQVAIVVLEHLAPRQPEAVVREVRRAMDRAIDEMEERRLPLIDLAPIVAALPKDRGEALASKFSESRSEALRLFAARFKRWRDREAAGRDRNEG